MAHTFVSQAKRRFVIVSFYSATNILTFGKKEGSRLNGGPQKGMSRS